MTVTEETPGTPDMPPAQAKLLAVTDGTPRATRELVDRVVAQFGHGLTRETVSRALNALVRAGHIDRLDQGGGRQALWTKTAGQTRDVT